jgi:predicted metal-binding transcription factor (methanogenesis marker protein 9)
MHIIKHEFGPATQPITSGFTQEPYTPYIATTAYICTILEPKWSRVDVVQPDGIYSHDYLSLNKQHKEKYSNNSRPRPREAQDSIKALTTLNTK